MLMIANHVFPVESSVFAWSAGQCCGDILMKNALYDYNDPENNCCVFFKELSITEREISVFNPFTQPGSDQ